MTPNDTFSEKATTWDSKPERVERARIVADAIAARLPLSPQTRILDFGCGTGLLGFALHDHGGSLTFMDTAPGMIAVVEEKIRESGNHGMTAMALDLATAPVPEMRFDVITTLMTLHHIENIPELIRKWTGMLQPGGHVAIADLDPEDGSFHDGNQNVHHGIARSDLEAWLSDAGFREFSTETVYSMEKTDENGTIRHYPLFLATARFSGV